MRASFFGSFKNYCSAILHHSSYRDRPCILFLTMQSLGDVLPADHLRGGKEPMVIIFFCILLKTLKTLSIKPGNDSFSEIWQYVQLSQIELDFESKFSFGNIGILAAALISSNNSQSLSAADGNSAHSANFHLLHHYLRPLLLLFCKKHPEKLNDAKYVWFITCSFQYVSSLPLSS